MTQKAEALNLLEQALKDLESPKGSVFSSVQKLSRAAVLVDNADIKIWCQIQFGDKKYVDEIQKLLSAATKSDYSSDKIKQQEIDKVFEKLEGLGLKRGLHLVTEELTLKNHAAGGGYLSIGFIEERYSDLARTKKGNDGTYYKTPLYNHLSYVRRKAHEFASELYNKLRFSGTVSNSFDLLKIVVDDKLLDLNPLLAEQLMIAFRSVSAPKAEEWSQALTSCRRLLEGLADELYPADQIPHKGRILGQGQYVNRLWAFMDNAIESESNRDLAKTHIDFLGSWLEKTNKITNKGVHADVEQIEAVKGVFHTYLVIADLLEYMGASQKVTTTLDVNAATIDELEALLDVSRNTAKEIIKARVQCGGLDKDSLSKVKGVGAKTMSRAIEVFNL
ncbi:helix-hairpin-helix domain-containing protein [Pseudomonas sp. RTB3]|uniref:ComEA family DNA-binding protein n=1 Tax=unclassified Pseudomonas TaxID=196821 RepID=UPI002B2265FE|nr:MULTISPECIES: helix-hairpin-helix domain-containing protein [unclassified Pseudomonas]MEB0006341.1 helix-hairpin-helix domain-containing protein [Pseudomonas sp. RTB2]MEB0018581.1 helix-hairpin-helix domain-containing protein [Pseudomonas sp. RTB3]MEB0269244.1 helix-hairpin-helix domain-containing protein [Pseudomonas sp. 5B4]